MLPTMGQKVNNVSFFDPKKEKEVERQRLMAQMLTKQGQTQMGKGNEMVSGIVVKKSPIEGLSAALQMGLGGLAEGRANKAEDESVAQRQRLMTEALGKYGTDPRGAAELLVQDPQSADMAFKLMMGQTEHERAKELMGMRLAAASSGGGGNTPAAMQIANQMFELEQSMNDPNLPEDQRFLAERQYNLLGQAAKTYGFDRGVQASAMGGYDSVYGGMQPVNMLPNGEMQAPIGGPTPEPLNPMQYKTMGQNQEFNDLIGGLTGQPMQEDPAAAHAKAVAMQQQQVGVNPYQRAELKPRQPVQMGEVAGFGQAVSGIAAQKKMAEGKASEVGKRQGENENLYRSVVSRMPQLEDTVAKLSKLGQAATYTNAGQVRDFAMRELGMDVPDSATARAEYISMVDNEILPLLRDTFGSQFTAKEGDSLRATLGNPNFSPVEKDAVLRSFIRTKMETINSMSREIGYGESLPSYTPQTIEIGGQAFNPTAQASQAPQMDRNIVMQKLQNAGATPQEIEAYMQARGL